jgi:hypothetical protein
MALDPSLITSVLSNWQTPDPAAAFAKIQALKNGFVQQQIQQQQLQEGAAKLQQEQQQISGTQALNDAIRQNMTTDATGAPVINHAAVTQALGTKGYGSLIPKYMEGVTAQQEAKAKLQKAQLDNQAAMLDQATRNFANATDQASWDAAIAHARGLGADPAALGIPAFYSDANKTAVANLALNAKDRIDAQAKTVEAQTKAAGEAREQKTQNEKDADAALQALAGANPDNFAALRADAIAKQRAAGRSPAQIPGSVAGLGDFGRSLQTAEQRIQSDQAAKDADALANYRTSQLANEAKRIATEQQNAGINAKKFAMDYGGDAIKGWAQQIAQNPDTANQVPPALRTPVMAQFTADTGRPFPKPLTGPAVTQESAARNALDAVNQINESLKDPEIQKRIGPILGRLGNAEQATGMALGLTPEQEAKAQQLRTNMRYLMFTEAKSLMGGRIPQQLMGQLESSSPNVAMDAGTLKGAMAGVTDAANRQLDQTYKQRYGEAAVRPLTPDRVNLANWRAQADAAPLGATIMIPDGKGGLRKALKTAQGAATPLQ